VITPPPTTFFIRARAFRVSYSGASGETLGLSSLKRFSLVILVCLCGDMLHELTLVSYSWGPGRFTDISLRFLLKNLCFSSELEPAIVVIVPEKSAFPMVAVGPPRPVMAVRELPASYFIVLVLVWFYGKPKHLSPPTVEYARDIAREVGAKFDFACARPPNVLNIGCLALMPRAGMFCRLMAVI
jgi:hypothetical protein